MKFIPQALDILSALQDNCPHLVTLSASGEYLVYDEDSHLCTIKAEAIDGERVLFTVYQDTPEDFIFETEVEEEVFEYLANPDNRLD